ncbi:ribosomal small subunit Rsm22 [Nitzschia inconspicua]|uniref:Ribosomal small subunit Rsm22 n=1 Tax=Nitzschia inconspicua TaxID=303405 RepID=A0A9K3LIG1_9STRA|nr:ribosomal small subunit Rsm22 [Nitzschia inconspicua]
MQRVIKTKTITTFTTIGRHHPQDHFTIHRLYFSSLTRKRRRPLPRDGGDTLLLPSTSSRKQNWRLSFNTENIFNRQYRGLASTSTATQGKDILYDHEKDEDVDDNDDNTYDIDDDEEDNNNDSFQPWKDLLENPGRAAWRVSSETPQPLLNAMSQILEDGDRTPKQLRRAHRKVLTIHAELATLRERERRKMVNGGRGQRSKRRSTEDDLDFDEIEDDDSSSSKKRSGAVVQVKDDDLNATSVYYGYDETLANLKHRLIPNYSIAKRVLSECQSLLGGPELCNWRPKRIVDFGMGCGSASAAAIDLFRDKQSGQTAIEWVHGIEPSVPMRECSRKLLEQMERHVEGTTTAPRITFGNSLSPPSSNELDHTNTTGSPSHGTFDLALLTYSSTELTDVTSNLAAAALLFEKLKPNGVLVMIEPGTPDGFNSIRGVRNMLLDCCPPHDPYFEWEERCHIIAPCTHNGSCPMERHRRNFAKQRGKLGYDMPQETVGNDNSISGEDKIAYDDEYYDDYDDDEDLVELDLANDSILSSETDAFNSSFCSFVQHIPGDDTPKGEKFSYLVAQKLRFSNPNDASVPNDSFEEDHLTYTLAQAFEAARNQDNDQSLQAFKRAQEMRLRYLQSDGDDLGLELIRGSNKRSSMGRIVRAPIKKKGHVYVDYCSSPGRIVRSRVTKAMSNNIAPGLFSAARKSRWGGLWPDMMKDVKDDASGK